MERKLIEVAFEITHRCNLRCKHCYNQNYLNSAKEMTTDQIFAALKEIKNFGTEKLKIGGGEPLVRQDFFEVYDYATSLGFEVNFSTNGILISKYLDKILENNIKKIQISLDNIGEKHDILRNHPKLFDKVEKVVKELGKNSININIATTLTKNNHEDLGKILSFCEENKIQRWKVIKYIPKNSGDELLLTKKEYRIAVSQMLEFKRKTDVPEVVVAREFDIIEVPSDYNDMQCFGGKSFLSLKPDGSITPCSYMNDFVCGNITRETIEEIWNSEKMIEFSKDYHDTNCIHGEKCRGGCKAISYFLNKEFGCDPYCWVK